MAAFLSKVGLENVVMTFRKRLGFFLVDTSLLVNKYVKLFQLFMTISQRLDRNIIFVGK